MNKFTSSGNMSLSFKKKKSLHVSKIEPVSCWPTGFFSGVCYLKPNTIIKK